MIQIYNWDNYGPSVSQKPEHQIEIIDDTLRDGLQSPSVKNPTLEEKIDILHWMDKLDIDVAPIGIPARGKAHYDEVLELTKACLQDKVQVKLLCGARTLEQDVKPIVEIVQKTGCDIETLIFLGSSAIRQKVENWSVGNLVENIEKSVSFAVKNNLKVTFATEDTMRTHPKRLEKFYLTAVDCGAKTICLSDTVGSVTPDGVCNIIQFMRNLLTVRGLDNIKIHFHGHMDRGLGVWNSIAALSAGANRVDGSILGIGERCGNTPMEQLLINLKLMGWIDNDLTSLGGYSETVSGYLNVPVPCNYPVTGRDAFRTGTGIHTAAILKAIENNDEWLANRVYSPYPPQWVGRELSIEVGPMSGKSNAVYWLKKNNFPVNDDMREKILIRAKESDRVLKDEEIMEVIKDNQ